MPYETPPALLGAIERRVREARASRESQRRALAELFRLFTTERARLGRIRYLDDPRLRLAYLRYHLPLNVVRAMWVLAEALRLDPGIRSLGQVVELGAGPGSASLASSFALGEGERTYVLTDQSRSALRLARELLAECTGAASTPLRVVTLEERLPQLPRISVPSLVWLSMVLNELGRGSRRTLELPRFLRRLEESLPAESRVAVVEPALRAPARRLLEVHDAALASGRWEVLAPCTHQKECPLLPIRSRPWCHFHFRWRAGRIVDEAAGPLGLNTRRASLSYLMLRRVPDSTPPPTRSTRFARVISDPMPLRDGATGVYVCRDGRRETLRELPHEVSRGDRVEASGPAGRPRIRRRAPSARGEGDAGSGEDGARPTRTRASSSRASPRAIRLPRAPRRGRGTPG